MKTCFKCNRLLPINEFYPHSQMGDGYLNKCKECNKKDVKENYAKRREQYSEYERMRNQDEQRKEMRLQYQRERRAKHPDKYRAWQAISYALRYKKIQRESCKFCGNPKSQAHHHDYSRPLDVVWVCFKCHREKFHNQVVIAVDV